MNIKKAEINLSQPLPLSAADLPIANEGEPPPPAPPLDVALDVRVSGRNQIFARGAGVFAELGGQVHLTGTLAAPNPEGGFMPALDLEATSTGTGRWR